MRKHQALPLFTDTANKTVLVLNVDDKNYLIRNSKHQPLVFECASDKRRNVRNWVISALFKHGYGLNHKLWSAIMDPTSFTVETDVPMSFDGFGFVMATVCAYDSEYMTSLNGYDVTTALLRAGGIVSGTVVRVS